MKVAQDTTDKVPGSGKELTASTLATGQDGTIAGCGFEVVSRWNRTTGGTVHKRGDTVLRLFDWKFQHKFERTSEEDLQPADYLPEMLVVLDSLEALPPDDVMRRAARALCDSSRRNATTARAATGESVRPSRSARGDASQRGQEARRTCEPHLRTPRRRGRRVNRDSQDPDRETETILTVCKCSTRVVTGTVSLLVPRTINCPRSPIWLRNLAGDAPVITWCFLQESARSSHSFLRQTEAAD